MSDTPEQLQTRLSSILSTHGLVRRGGQLILEPYPTQMARRHEHRRQHFRVSTFGRVVCHVVTGPHLAEEYRLAQEFHQACPDLVCRPLFFQDSEDGLSCLGLEHFDGVSLDQAVAIGRCDATQWLAAVRRVQARLEKTSQPGREAERDREIACLVAKMETFAGFTPVDRALLRDLIEPALRVGARAAPLTLRWSNGDFVGRNVLINTEGDIRLIDYEYATLTHFGATDWLRLAQFSAVPEGLDWTSVPEFLEAAQPGQKVHLWMHQLIQLLRANSNTTVRRHIGQVASHLLEAVTLTGVKPASSTVHSFMIDSLVTQKGEAEKLVAERTTWARSLEQDLQAARVAHAQLTKEHTERTAWAKSLDQDLQATKAHFTQLALEHEERTAWAQSLENELQAAKANLSRLTQELTERTMWAQSLEQDLQAAQTRFAQLSADYAERTAWAQSLESELQAAKASLSHQTQELSTRAAWAQSLEQDLQAAQTRFAQLTTEHAERTTWARSLEAELQLARENHTRLTAEFAERTAWARALDAELARSRRTCDEQEQALKLQVAECTRVQARLLELETQANATTTQLSELQEIAQALIAHQPAEASGNVFALIGQALVNLAHVQRDLITARAQQKLTEGEALAARLQTEAAESETRRLHRALLDAQVHVDHLLDETSRLRQHADLLTAARIQTAETLDQRTRELQQVQDMADRLQRTLAHFESMAAFRLLARISKPPPDLANHS